MKHTMKKIYQAVAALLTLALVLPLLSFGSFAAADTVMLTADSSEAITVAAGEEKILDLAGHTLSATVTNHGILTVTDSVGGGKIGFTTNAGDVQAAIQNYGTLTLSGGALEVIGTGGTTQATGIFNRKGATMKMDGGSIEVITNGSYWCYGMINEGTVTEISGGSIRAIKNHTTSGLNIMCINNRNGGVVELISGGTMYTYHKGNGGESIGLRNQGNASLTKMTGGSIWAECESSGSGVAFGIKNDGGTVGEIAGGTITAYTKSRDFCFGLRNSAGSTVKKISGGLIQAFMMHKQQGPNSIAIANWGRIDEISGGTMYAESINNNGTIIGLRNQNNTASVGKISGGSFIAKVTEGSNCKAFGIYNQGGKIEEITDGLFYGATYSGQWAFGLWNAATINKISGGTFVGHIDHKDNAPNSIGLSNDGTVDSITGGVYHAYSTHPSGGTFAIRNKKTIGSISGGALYNSYSRCNFLLTEGGTTTFANGYALNESGTGDASSESGYKYIIPTGATVSEAYLDGESLMTGTVSQNGSAVAAYKLYGTALNVASVNNALYPSVEEACAAAAEGDTVTLLSDVAEAVVPAGAKVKLDLAGYHIHDLSVADGASVTVTGGFIDGNVTSGATLILVAVKGDATAATVADGYVLTAKKDSGYAYVIPADGAVVELYDGANLVAARIFDKDGKAVSTVGTTEQKGLLLVGWSLEKNAVPTIADSAVTAEMSVLYGTWTRRPLYYFLGSSVTYGSATGGRSFVEEIAALYPIAYNKQAVSGTTLVDNGASSYVQRMLSGFDTEIAPDRLIVQLSTNDASQNKPLGSVSDSKNAADFDKSTIIGAMEYIIAYAKDTWNAPVAFYTNPYYNNATYEKMIAALYDLQEKWGIQIFDFYYYVDMEELPAATLSSYMADAIHPNATGYRWMAGIMGKMLLDADHGEEDHAGVHVTTDPTCTAGGHTDYDCVICGKPVRVSETDPLEHSFESGACTVCGAPDPDYKEPETEEPKTEEELPPVVATGDAILPITLLALLSIGAAAVMTKKRICK